ncbi:hypothetical protein A1E89_RS00820 [Acinetobacter baumannii]|uniref:hypothetical protein n=1 Tax=Acinetobacter TaxID=469 RepID=UPI00042452B2|nr:MULTISPECIES: hypothetical protein [Acinetobacter]EHU1905456.1 hypothetical protein [Acinetobacter baumannii]EIY0852862.1 hypothetical protein [Acinetobacter baumannii]EKV2731454.1 hypothetical protein [Acinetobacter baumannii]KAF6711405.1 hypothetical protein G9371_01070 [Acinetobacter sp. EKM10A]MCZ2955423.1 hypothetical protein [Acinetobacter baumannii]
MKISNNLLNNNLWRRIERIKNLSDRYKTAAEYRLKDISHEKPVGIKISSNKLTIKLQYTFEKFEIINKALIKKFSKLDSFSNFERLVESENILDHRGWHNLGLIFDEKSTDWRSNFSGIKIKNFPKHTDYISCTIHRIVPSTSFLCFDFFLDNSFYNDIYKNFYSENDVIVTSDDFLLRRTSIQAKSSANKFNEALNKKIEYFEDWILRFLKIEKNTVLSMNSTYETSIKKICSKRPNNELIRRNFSFLQSQSFSINSFNCFTNENDYYYIENINDIRVFKFEKDDEDHGNHHNYFIKSLMILIAINTYKKELEIIRENNLKIKKKSDLLKIKNNILKANTLDFQINRLFQELNFESKNNYIFHAIKEYNFKSTSKISNIEYNIEFQNRVNFYSELLRKNSESLKKLLELEFNSKTTETNYLLQNRMKWLTIATVFLALASLLVTIISADKKNMEETWENLKTYPNSISRITNK